MQDRFKFRWFSKLHKKVFDVVGLEFPNFVIYKDEQGNEVETGLSSDNGELIQCTGLKDKNGKLIYEGDIVEVINCRGAKAVVKFNTELVKFELKGEKFAPSALQHIRRDYFEVIGNIYETPKLLETH